MDKNDLKTKLSDMAFMVTQHNATEPPFSGKYLAKKDKGVYSCVVCGATLFSSADKYFDGGGWPSFADIAKTGKVIINEDLSHGMVRTEVKCANCMAHLGHLFDDGPKEKGGKHYCINSCALDFKEK